MRTPSRTTSKEMLHVAVQPPSAKVTPFVGQNHAEERSLRVASNIPQQSTRQRRRDNADHLAGSHKIRRKDLSVLQQASTVPIPNLLPITQQQDFVFNSSVLLSQLQLLHAPSSVTPFCPEKDKELEVQGSIQLGCKLLRSQKSSFFSEM